MAEIKVEEAKKELGDMVSKQKAELEKNKDAQLSIEQLKVAEDKKKEVEELRIQQETQAKKEAELLVKKDEELSEEEKKLKPELLKKKQDEELSKLSVEEKVKRTKEESQKRIDEISNELKQMKDSSSKDIELLKKKLELLEHEKVELEKKFIQRPDDTNKLEEIVEKEEEERVKKYLQEDESLPIHKRREMSEDELEDFLLTDLKSASAWIARRERRREQEKQSSLTKHTQDKKIEVLLARQAESANRVNLEHPELVQGHKRTEELKAQGKSKEEIFKIVSEENPKWKLAQEVLQENPDKYLFIENGPELIAAELGRRLKNKSSDNKPAESEELTALRKQVEDMSAALAEFTGKDIGISSTVRREQGDKAKLSDAEEKLVQTMKDLNLPQERIDSALKKFKEGQKK